MKALYGTCGYLGMASLVLAGAPLAAQQFDYTGGVGVADPAPGRRICISINAADLTPATPLTLVEVPIAGTSGSPQVVALRIVENAEAPCDVEAGTESGDVGYTAVAADSLTRVTGTGPYFAVIVPAGRLAIDGQRVYGDLDGDGVPEEFRICTSREGLHLAVWSGQPLVGDRRWHRYYYVGYDLESTCVDADFPG